MIKAAAGGGGRGMRVVESETQLDGALGYAQREAMSGFHDDRVFLERYIAASRHVEIQILGDQHGHLVHLGERDCSIQRRHQKLIEESPSPALGDELRESMGTRRSSSREPSATSQLARSSSSSMTPPSEFYFLEVNARLQVEHPVTEDVTDIDLVREQLRIAAGEELGYSQGDIHFSGHAIEVRLCAEDPEHGFLPATGRLEAFETPAQPAVRWESGVERGSLVTVEFDPLLAKVISHAPTRIEAARSLALALEAMHLGGVTTNRDFLAATLRHERFLAGDTTTDFIERVEPARVMRLSDGDAAWLASAGALWLQGLHRLEAPVLKEVPSGWRNARLPRQHVALRDGERHLDVQYASRRDGSFDIERSGARASTTGAVEASTSRSPRCADACGSLTRATTSMCRPFEERSISRSSLVLKRRAAPSRLADSAPRCRGSFSTFTLRVDQHVLAGDTLVVMEAMKMEHVITAPYSGTVSAILVTKDQQVERDSQLLTLEPDDQEDAS